MSKHRATPRHNAAHRAARARPRGRLAALAALLTASAVAVPALLPTQDLPNLNAADRDDAAPQPSASAVPSPTQASEQPDGDVALGRLRNPTPAKRTRPAPRVPEQGPGTFQVAAAPAVSFEGATTYRVEVEDGLSFPAPHVAEFVEETLTDQRGWAARHQLVRVDGHADLRIVLATPETADQLCAPLDTGGPLSCCNGEDVVVNAWRWQFGADSYPGDLTGYRRYVVNHETGHALGYPHVSCPGSGQMAPVMLQQTKGLEGCEPNPWPARVDLLGH